MSFRQQYVILLVGSLLGLQLFIGSIGRAASNMLLEPSSNMPDNDHEAVQSLVATADNSVPKNCRYGVSGWGSDQLSQLDQFGLGWFLNFGTTTTPASSDIEFVPVITVNQKKQNGAYLPEYIVNPPLTAGGLGSRIAANPGALWIVGNEVDRAFIQGDMYPDIYAVAYHDIYHFIKSWDPKAQVAISGLVQVTPGRLQYLDMVWDAYISKYGNPIPVDVWNMHIYILPEKRADGSGVGAHIAVGTDPALALLDSGAPPNPALCPLDNVICVAEHDDLDLFKQQVVAMRTWMKNKGVQDKPLILSEFSLLYPYADYDNYLNPTTCFVMDEFGQCFSPQRVSTFMSHTVNYLENAKDPALGYPRDDNRLVQQWLWYAMRVEEDDTGGSSNLLQANLTSLTPMGQQYANEIAARPLTINLFPDSASYPVGFTAAPTGTTSVPLSVIIRNNGNTAVATPFNVTFYRDPGLTQPIGTTVISGLGGCVRPTVTATVTWHNLGPGVYPYWAKVDSSNVIPESNKNDNVISGLVIIDPQQIFLPIVRR